MSDGHLPWGLEKDGLKAGVAKTSMTLARPKKTFKKKSRLQMHREEAERKEREVGSRGGPGGLERELGGGPGKGVGGG